jgi:hypothetical protein
LNVCFLQIETLNNKARERREGEPQDGERDMASSIAQIMQSMRPEYIILSCEPRREGDWRERREIGRDRKRE